MLECNHDRDDAGAVALPRVAEGAHRRAVTATWRTTARRRSSPNAIHAGLRHVVAAHLSEQNNSAALAAEALGSGLRRRSRRDIVVADAATARAGCHGIA